MKIIHHPNRKHPYEIKFGRKGLETNIHLDKKQLIKLRNLINTRNL